MFSCSLSRPTGHTSYRSTDTVTALFARSLAKSASYLVFQRFFNFHQFCANPLVHSDLRRPNTELSLWCWHLLYFFITTVYIYLHMKIWLAPSTAYVLSFVFSYRISSPIGVSAPKLGVDTSVLSLHYSAMGAAVPIARQHCCWWRYILSVFISLSPVPFFVVRVRESKKTCVTYMSQLESSCSCASLSRTE